MEKDASTGYSSKTSSDHNKKLKLFGVELDPSTNGDRTILSKGEDHNTSPTELVEEKKFECQFCFKEFANSQALGGHQNAHKKERFKKKRLQLRAMKASSNFYKNSHHGSSAGCWWYKNSHQISFGSSDHLQDQAGFQYILPASQGDGLFSLKPVSSSLPVPKQSCKSNLDLRLALGLDSNIPSSSRSGV